MLYGPSVAAGTRDDVSRMPTTPQASPKAWPIRMGSSRRRESARNEVVTNRRERGGRRDGASLGSFAVNAAMAHEFFSPKQLRVSKFTRARLSAGDARG